MSEEKVKEALDQAVGNVKIEGPATADNIVKSFTWLN